MDPLSQIIGSLGTDAVHVSPGEVLVALALSSVLTLVVGAIYQVTHRGQFYTQGFVHTLVVMGTLVTAIIMVIGDNVGRAFAVFGVFSIIRFRNVLPETRDMAFLFFALAVGLAVGAQQYLMAVVTTLSVSLLVLALWRFDLFAPVRTSHILRIRVSNDLDYDSAFAPVFEAMLERSELISVESVQAGMMTEIKYAVRLKADTAPGELVSELQRANGNNRVVLQAFGPNVGDYRVGDFGR